MGRAEYDRVTFGKGRVGRAPADRLGVDSDDKVFAPEAGRFAARRAAEPGGAVFDRVPFEGKRAVGATCRQWGRARRRARGGDIHASVMMLAEKASALIPGNTPLPPSTVDFHQHRTRER